MPRSNVSWQELWLRRANAGLAGDRESELERPELVHTSPPPPADPDDSSDDGEQPTGADGDRELERGHIHVTLYRPAKVDLYDVIAGVWQIYEPRRVRLDFELEPDGQAEED